MRVVNDRQQEKTEPSEIGFFPIAAYAILCGFGMASVLLSPLPMILSHLRLSGPWPKVAAIIGAVIAVAVLEVPLPLAVVTFVLGLYIADYVTQGSSPWALIRNVVALAAALGGGALFLLSQAARMSTTEYWAARIGEVITGLKASLQVDASFDWEALRTFLLFEGPFFYLGVVVVATWVSIGLAAHLDWFPEEHPFSGRNLRTMRLSPWVSGLFLVLMGGAFLLRPPIQPYFAGAFRLVSTIVFIQGSIVLSEVLRRREVRPRLRTIVFSAAVALGFYALVGMGAMSPWIVKQRKLEEVT